jgi:carboxyl-terminal processing protease
MLPPFISRYRIAILIFLFAALQILVISVSFLSGYLARDLPLTSSLLTKGRFPVLSEAMSILKDNGLNPLPEPKQLEYGMIRGMLQAYNEPFTVFVEPPQHELQTNQLQGKFGGIGVRIERDAQNYVYLYPLPNSPSLIAGVQEGDRLLSVEDLQIGQKTTNDDVQAAVRGPVGEKVTIAVGRAPDYTPIKFSIARAEVSVPSITWNFSPDEPSVGLVQVQVIADSTPDEVSKAIIDLQSRGATYFILDLRNNGGGLVDAGVDTARLFLKEGTIMQQQYRGQEIRTYKVDQPGPFADLPLVILVNKGTASAAEILAGALQGQKRALLVGTRTYGKDSIQLVFDLSDGSSLHVTAAHWWIPGITIKIGENGLQPDITVAETAAPQEALQAAIQAIIQ